jgi:predicted DNA-binding transcriptional regulator AlpA
MAVRKVSLLTIKEVLTRLRRSAKSRQVVYDLIRDAAFPPGTRLGGKGPRVWSETEVDRWILDEMRS